MKVSKRKRITYNESYPRSLRQQIQLALSLSQAEAEAAKSKPNNKVGGEGSASQTPSHPSTPPSKSLKRQLQSQTQEVVTPARKRQRGRARRQSGLWTTVHGSVMCGYVCLSEGNKRRYGRPCSQYAARGSKFCAQHASFERDLQSEFQRIVAAGEGGTPLPPDYYTKKYCICQDTYQDGDFMIQCDRCLDWFHGECVGVTPEHADAMSQYICDLCR